MGHVLVLSRGHQAHSQLLQHSNWSGGFKYLTNGESPYLSRFAIVCGGADSALASRQQTDHPAKMDSCQPAFNARVADMISFLRLLKPINKHRFLSELVCCFPAAVRIVSLCFQRRCLHWPIVNSWLYTLKHHQVRNIALLATQIFPLGIMWSIHPSPWEYTEYFPHPILVILTKLILNSPILKVGSWGT